MNDLKGYLMMLGIVLLIVILLIYLLGDSALFKGAAGKLKKIFGKASNENGAVEIGECPHYVLIKNPFTGEYFSTQIDRTKKKITIGSSKDNDIVIDFPTVEPLHAILEKRGDVYKLVPHAKDNYTLYGNRKPNGQYAPKGSGKWEKIGLFGHFPTVFPKPLDTTLDKDGIIRTVFLLGENVKIIFCKESKIVKPSPTTVITKTFEQGKKDTLGQKAKAAQSPDKDLKKETVNKKSTKRPSEFVMDPEDYGF